MSKPEVVIGIITISISIVFFVFKELYKGDPTLSIEQNHKSIILKNQGNAEAEIIDSMFIKNDKIYCMSNNNINNHLGSSVFKYKIDVDDIRPDYKIGTESVLKLATCVTRFCDTLYLDSPINNIHVYMQYKGTGFLDRTKTTCSSNIICQKYFESSFTSCEEVKI